MMHLIFRLSFIVFLFVPSTGMALEGPRIYLIRHGAVNIESPGWSGSKGAYAYRVRYNKAPIRDFDPAATLKKVGDLSSIDTIFTSPQARAIQTASILFGHNAILRTNNNLMEFQYKVVRWPLVQMPVRAWLATSFIAWKAGNNADSLPTYRQRKQCIEVYSDELIRYAEEHGKTIVVAHGIVNRELIKILKKKGWKLKTRDGNGNLSVNCLEKPIDTKE